VGLEQGPLSLMSTTEELLERKSSGSSLENREYGHRDLLCWPHNTLYMQKLALISPTSGGRSAGIVHSWTKAMEILEIYLDSSPKQIRLFNTAFNSSCCKVSNNKNSE
jgi:hypothetical protein